MFAVYQPTTIKSLTVGWSRIRLLHLVLFINNNIESFSSKIVHRTHLFLIPSFKNMHRTYWFSYTLSKKVLRTHLFLGPFSKKVCRTYLFSLPLFKKVLRTHLSLIPLFKKVYRTCLFSQFLCSEISIHYSNFLTRKSCSPTAFMKR